MDNKCPQCGFDLSKSVLIYAKPKMKGAFAEFIEKVPIICTQCKADLELNHHRLESVRVCYQFSFYVLLYALINIKHIHIIYIAIFLLIFIKVESFLFNKKLKLWARYKIYENPKGSEKIFGYVLGSFLYFVLFLVVIFTTTMIISLFYYQVLP